MSKIAPLSGFPELLPAQRVVEREVIASVSRTFELHGFTNIETRVVEPVDRLAKGGEVDKEIYVLQRIAAQPDSRATDGEEVEAIPIDEFGIEGPRMVRCLSLRYQVAQKLHAVTQRFEGGENERFRDLIDLIICRELIADLGEVREACIDTFEARGLHAWPPTLQVPDSWAESYTALAEEMDFPVTDVGEAAARVRELISDIDAN